MYLIIGVAVAFVGTFFFNVQRETRDFYVAVSRGGQAKATAHKFPNITYKEGEKNIYLYTFTVDKDTEDKETYVSSTIRPQPASILETGLWISYAVNTDGSVRLNGEGKVDIDGEKYAMALSYEKAYIDNTREPSVVSGVGILMIAGLLLAYALYNAVWILVYKNVERKGELSYAIFVSASASKLGPSKYMSVVYKYKDAGGEWVEAKTPYTFTGLDADKLKLLDTFKICVKGKRSVVAEKLSRLRL